MPSDVLDYVRSKDKRFADVPDDELTLFIGDRAPEFLKDQQFKSDYQTAKEGQAAAVSAATALSTASTVQRIMGDPGVAAASEAGQRQIAGVERNLADKSLPSLRPYNPTFLDRLQTAMPSIFGTPGEDPPDSVPKGAIPVIGRILFGKPTLPGERVEPGLLKFSPGTLMPEQSTYLGELEKQAASQVNIENLSIVGALGKLSRAGGAVANWAKSALAAYFAKTGTEMAATAAGERAAGVPSSPQQKAQRDFEIGFGTLMAGGPVAIESGAAGAALGAVRDAIAKTREVAPATAAALSQQIEQAPKPAPTESVKPTETKGPENAIPQRSAEAVHVEVPPGNRPEVGGRVSQPEETAVPQKQEGQVKEPEIAPPVEPTAQPAATPSVTAAGVPSKMMAAGETATTSSGRTTTPFPNADANTPRKATAAVQRVHTWLRQNALDEATSRGDEFNALQFRNANPKKLTQAESDSMNEYLFGQQPDVPRPILNTVSPTPEPPMTFTTSNGKRAFSALVGKLGRNDLDALAFYFQDSQQSLGDVSLNSAGDALRYANPERARATGETQRGAATGSVHSDFANWLMSDQPLKERTDPEEAALIQKARDIIREKMGVKAKVTEPPAVEKPKSAGASVEAQPETITAAAYRDEQGNVHQGANHPEILQRLGVKGFESRESRNTPSFGYSTDKRPFVTREEAAPIIEKSGQKLETFDQGDTQPHADQIAAVPGGGMPLSEADIGEQQVLAEIEKQKTGTGPLTDAERIELNELRIVKDQRGKLGRLNQARLDWLEGREKGQTSPLEPPAIPLEHPEPGTSEANAIASRSDELSKEEDALSEKLRETEAVANKAGYGTKRKEQAEAKAEKLREQLWSMQKENAQAHQASRDMYLEHLIRSGHWSQKWAATVEMLKRRAERISKQSDELREQGDRKGADDLHYKSRQIGEQARSIADRGYELMRREASRQLQAAGATKEEADFEAGQSANMQMSYPGMKTMQELHYRMKAIESGRLKQKVEAEAKALMDEFGVVRDDAFQRKLSNALPNEERAREIIAEQRKRYEADKAAKEAKDEDARKKAREAQEAGLVEARRLQSAGKLQWVRMGGNIAVYWSPVDGKPVSIKAAPNHEFFVYHAGVSRWAVTESKSGLRVEEGPTKAEAIANAEKKISEFGKAKFDDLVQKASASSPPKPDLSTPPEPPKEIIGMGGATPSEFELGQGTPTSIKNAQVDRERSLRGLPPAVQPARRAFGEVWDRAMAMIDQDPGVVDRLIDSLRKTPRALTDLEDAMLLHRQVDLQNEYGKATRDLAQAYDDGRTDAVAQEKLRVAQISDKLLDLYNVGKRVGTETGRGLNARKMMANEDFSLAQMELDKRLANEGKPLTDAQRAEIQQLHDKIAATQKAYDDYVAATQERLSKLEADKAIAELKAKQAPAFDRRVLAKAEAIVSRMEKAAEPAAQRLRERLARMSAGVDPTIVMDAAIVGSAKIARMGLDLARFTDEMVREFGEKLRPMIGEIWQASNDMLDKATAAEPETRKVIRKATLAQVKEAVTKTVRDKASAGKLDEITWQVQQLARALVKEGVSDREQLIDEVHRVLQDAIPGISRRQTMDAISGYGDYKQLSKDEITVKLRGMKGEMQQLSKLEDMAKGQPPLKSGVERRTPTEAERKLIKEVNDAKAKFQVPVSDPETQLKSALDTLKTTLRNRITDYEDRIARGDYAARPRRQIQLDSEATRLKAENERVKKKFQEGLQADRMKNRVPWEKTMDWSTKFRRFTALSSPMVIPKLLGAALWRGVFTPLEDIAGSVLSKIPGVRGISERAPTEGAGGQLKDTMRGYGQAFTRGMIDAAQVARTGRSDIDVLYGKAGESYTGENELASLLLNIPGRSHGVIKAPVKRGGYAKAESRLVRWHAQTAQKLGEWYAKQGFPVDQEAMRYRIALDAYKYGNRQIFLQPNRVADAFNAALAHLESKGESGHPSPGGKALATVARFIFPVTKVPTNIAGETLQYTAGGLTGPVRAANAIRKGLDNLTPNQADLIMREMKKGSIGLAALALGYIGYKEIGGTYQEGEKRKTGELKPGEVEMFGERIPANLMHHPALNTIQLGATFHRVADSKLRKNDPDTQGATAGLLAVGWGLADEVPFIQGPHRIFGGLANTYTRQQTIGNEVRGIVIPQAVAWVAQVLDERRETPPTNLYERITGPPARLKPRTTLESIETGIPVLRERVPERQNR